jgi:dTDP-4-dehydrorhamnose 3,5-epimerase
VRCVEGEIFDVAVDIRPSSPTFGRWVGATLSAANRHQLWVPAGFAHGFCVVGDAAQVEYACTALYDREDEIGVRWNDPAIGITWPITEPTLSPKDRNAPTLAEIRPRLLDP